MKAIRPSDELPMNRFMNPMGLLYAIPNKGPVDCIDLLRMCGIQILVNDQPQPPQRPPSPCRDLAAGILLQAIEDAVWSKGKDKWEARHWLLNDTEWFPIWCNILDLDPTEVRKQLLGRLDGNHYTGNSLSRYQQSGREHHVH